MASQFIGIHADAQEESSLRFLKKEIAKLLREQD